MTKIHQNKALFIFVITAFLAVQWSSAHIHLAAHHDHDGSHHQHVPQGHLHDLGSHHADAIDISHADSHENIVELDHESTSPSWKKLDDHQDALAPPHRHFVCQLRCTEISSSEDEPLGSSWLTYSNIRLRAPPQFTS